MAWSDKLKLNKQLVRSLTDSGYAEPKEIQHKILPRIAGGQDVIAIGPEGCGKTTTYVLAVLNKLKHTNEGVPRTLILVPDKDGVMAVISRFEQLNKNKAVLIVGLYAAPGIESQMNALADGADIVVATPDRARAIYLKLGLNLNKIELLIVDDAELMVKQGLQLQVAELANSITKSQHLVFTEVMHERLNKMIAPFMKEPAVVEVEDVGSQKIPTLPQVLYHLPNFGTKLNLLNLFMADDELFTKIVVFVNTRQTAEKLYKSLQSRNKRSVAVYKSWSVEINGLSTISDFSEQSEARALIVANENKETIGLRDVPFLLHFDLPDDQELFVSRVTKPADAANDEDIALAITFATDLELAAVRRIEKAIGAKIPVAELPEELLIEKERKNNEKEGSQPRHKSSEPVVGEAFHEKKASNAKTFNFSSGQKAKMNNKRKH